MLTLGIPGDTATALLLAALTIHGVQSGPLLMSEGGGVFGVIVGLVLFANVVLLPVSLTGIKIFAKIAEIPKPVLLPIIINLTVIGAYSIKLNLMDVYFMIGFGIAGYFLKLHNFATGPIALGLILCSLLELNLRRSMTMARFSVGKFFLDIFTHPLSLILFLLVAVMFLSQLGVLAKWKGRKGKKEM